MFGRKKTIDDMTTEEIEAYLEKRKASAPSEQSEQDRTDESVAMQEKDSGIEDTQSALDRVDEAEGEDKALEEEQSEPSEESHPDAAEDKRQIDELLAPIRQELAALREEVAALKREPREADKDTVTKLTELENKYTN